MRPHLLGHFIQQLFAGQTVPPAGNVRPYRGIADDSIDASHNRRPASTSHMQSVCSHRVQLPLSLEWPIAASVGLLGGIIAAECGDTAPSRIIQGHFVLRWEHETLLEAVQQRLDANTQTMRQRRKTVEHPFGTIKALWKRHTS